MQYLWTNIALSLTEQVDQRQTWTREDLDQLSCVFICPTFLVSTLTPQYGSQNSEFTGMTVLTVGVERMAAGLSRITVNYVGKLSVSGNHTYVSDTRIDSNWTEGEVSYSVNYISEALQNGYVTYHSVKASLSQRYTGMGCTIKYVTNSRPSAGLFAALAAPYLGFTNIVIVQTGVQILSSNGSRAGLTVAGQVPPTQQMSLVDLSITDRFGWYQVTESYTSKMFPGAIVLAS